MTKILLNKSNVDLDYPVVRPSLDLDFTQEELDPRITFSRGSIGTRVNRNRLIETVDANQPRFDYDPVTGECKGLLIEESRQNLLTWSEDFSNAIWSAAATNIINNNSTTSPTGSTNGNQITNNSITNNFNFISQQYSSTTKGSYTYSLFVKNNNISTISFLVGTDGYATNYARATYTFSSQSFGSFQYIGTPTNWVSSTSSTAYPNGWYKVSITFNTTNFTSQSTLNVGFYPGVYASTKLSYLKSFYVWGAQLEAGAFPTSYIPTAASTVTRSADTASMTGTNFFSWYNSSEGTLYARWSIPVKPSGFPGIAAIQDSGRNNGVIISTNLNNNNRVTVRGSNLTIIDDYTNLTIPLNSVAGSAIAYRTNSTTTDAFYSGNGGNESSRSVTKNIPIVNVDRLLLGNNVGNILSGHIRRVTYYPRALKPNQLVALTQ